jgi:hypothetical protein
LKVGKVRRVKNRKVIEHTAAFLLVHEIGPEWARALLFFFSFTYQVLVQYPRTTFISGQTKRDFNQIPGCRSSDKGENDAGEASQVSKCHEL